MTDNNTQNKELISTFTWIITGFSKRKEKKICSEVFTSNSNPNEHWRLLLYPKGSQDHDFASLFLEAYDTKGELPFGWKRDVKFTFILKNAKSTQDDLKQNTSHRFTGTQTDWGFVRFIEIKKLQKGFIANDIVTIVAYLYDYSPPSFVSSLEDSPVPRTISLHNLSTISINSRETTGWVGIKNQGATCYLNSLLQSLFHLGYFRKAVYMMPSLHDIQQGKSSIPLALQRLFYNLQFSENSVSTKELTASFGWNQYEAFVQHDVQELNRVLCDKIESKMKGTPAEGAVQKLFTGKVLSYIQCKNVNYKSEPIESFYDLSLDVKGCKDIYASLDKYVSPENLDGENKYHAEGYGLQAALKEFPPVLQIQLKRFEYDPLKDSMTKVNDKYVFPKTLDLNKYLDSAAESRDYNYQLHGVLVHSGTVHGGHYYAFIRPNTTDEWYKFDDERVSAVGSEQAVEENYGGDMDDYSGAGLSLPTYNALPFLSKKTNFKTANAYMLVYIKENERGEILCDVTDDDIPKYLKEAFEQDQQQAIERQQYLAQAHLYITLKIVTKADLEAYESLSFDLIDFDNVRSFRMKKTSTLKDFKVMASTTLNVPVERQRYWNWVPRSNRTIRPDLPLSPRDQERMLSDLCRMGDLKLFLEVSQKPAEPNEMDLFDPHTEDDVLLFCKFYDPRKSKVKFIDFLTANKKTTVAEFIPRLNKMMGFSIDQPLLVYEEVKPSMVIPLKGFYSVEDAELGNGDIIVFQQPLEVMEQLDASIPFPSAKSFYDYIVNRVTVEFRQLDRPKDFVCTLEMSKTMRYDEITTKLAKVINADSTKIRLTCHNVQLNQPRMAPVKRNENLTLSEMLAANYSFSENDVDILYFEVLDIPLSELESKRLLNVTWVEWNLSTKNITVLVPHQAVMKDVADQIQLQIPTTHPIRLYEVYNSKIQKLLGESDTVVSLATYTTLFAEETPKDEIDLDKNSKMIPVGHYFKDGSMIQQFGIPFFVAVKKGELLKDIKKKIISRMSLKDADKFKWAFVSFGRMDYLKDSENLMKRSFTGTDYLGIEHEVLPSDQASKKTKTNSIRRAEKAVTIKG